MRLDKFLCDNGLGSRKDVKEYIKRGRVTVDGTLAKSPDTQIEPENTRVCFDGKAIAYERFHYYMLNKPQGVVSSTKEEPGHHENGGFWEPGTYLDGQHAPGDRAATVIDLLVSENVKKLAPVGRLDKDTEGLLLLTDDGALAHRLLSPKKHVDKTYEVHLERDISDAAIELLENGVDIGDEKLTYPARVERADNYGEGNFVIYLTIHEGRFHQIKRMLQAVGNEVVFLKRLSMGPLRLDPGLATGEYRRLTEEELALLQNSGEGAH